MAVAAEKKRARGVVVFFWAAGGGMPSSRDQVPLPVEVLLPSGLCNQPQLASMVVSPC